MGIESPGGTDALQYSSDSPALKDGQSLTFAASRHGLLTGTVTDANDGKPLAGATVKVGDLATLTTGENGTFIGQVLAGRLPGRGLQGELRNLHPGRHRRRRSLGPGRHRPDHRPGGGLGRRADPGHAGRVHQERHGRAVQPRRRHDLHRRERSRAELAECDPHRWRSRLGQVGDVEDPASSAGVPAGQRPTGKLLVRSASGRNPQIGSP